MRSQAVVLLAALALAGCQGLTRSEEARYGEIEKLGLETQEPKSPVLAGALNVLPGFGDVYTGSWGAFALDFLFWPFSAAWAVPQGIITADNVNKGETVAYYHDGLGRKTLAEARARAGVGGEP